MSIGHRVQVVGGAGKVRRGGPAFALLLALGFAGRAWAAEDPQAEAEAQQMAAEAPPIDVDDPVASVPSQQELNRDPLRAGLLLMELTSRAEAAERDAKLPEALRYYAAIAQAVPDRALPFSKMCELSVALAQPGEARAACRRATELQGAKLVDHLRYASVLLGEVPAGAGEGTRPAPEDVAELDATFQHLENQHVTAVEVDYLACKLALRLEDVERLRRCVARLVEKRPTDPVTLSHQFSLALLEHDEAGARSVIEQARRAGLPDAALSLMQDELEARAGTPPLLRLAEALGALGLLGASAWAGRNLWRRRRRPATV